MSTSFKPKTFLTKPLEVTAACLLGLTAVAVTSLPASAQLAHSSSHHGGGGGTTGPVGNDISYPQCSTRLPTGQAFGIVGVDDGIANRANPCLGTPTGGTYKGSELYWATTSAGGTSQPGAGLYVNTADPGNVYNGTPIADWPQTNSGGGSDPYGACTTTTYNNQTIGADTQACAWQYGWNLASQDVNIFFAQAAASVSTQGVSDVAGDYPW
jgi:hypothetical protein